MKIINNLPRTLSLLATTIAISCSAVAAEQWPDLPKGIKDGISAQVGNKLYVGLGAMGNDFYMLDLNAKDKGWQKQASFSGPNRGGATASVIGDDVYVFGGSGKVQSDDKSPILFDTVYRYDGNKNSWSQVNTASPVGLLGAASYSPDNQQIVFFGGYDKAYFDQYLSDVLTTDKEANPEAWQKIVDDYMGMKPIDYRWNRSVLSYSPQTNQWTNLGTSPYVPNCGAAIVTEGKNALLVSGEIKPGLRTSEVKQFRFGAEQPWQSEHALPAPNNAPMQEGVAGAFAGTSNGVTLVAGGANFHGAIAAFEKGSMFAHNGLAKAYNPEIYVQKDGLWSQTNDLPQGLAYGASFTTPEGVLIVGGETPERNASSKVYMLAWNGNSVDIND
ncbi:YjhT family mutarotase [Vibrio sinensis]|uniref:N-acetylneuraminate epimerase n=1 Tax=Vibrio sinensis TaxID=2302434 RepID=A0A3A6RE15_9VIBR|nr:N-acetylneuraminate epimerase [Vibrio sinensis]RJX75372.1 YjhT family mutarotase [Vibrio sinensis]